MRPRIPTTFPDDQPQPGDDHDPNDTSETYDEEEVPIHNYDSDHNDEYSDDNDHDYEHDYDDEEPPVWTFRVLYLGSLSSSFLYILNKFFLHQTAQCIMSMVITVAFLYLLGHIMAKMMPKRRVFLRTFGVEFCLNPGPFDVRELALISIFANSGAAYGGITSHYVHSFGSFKHENY